jgi:DNA-binding response OmpR family regulator
MNSVLIIDDDKELCTLMKKCVEQENLSAVVAHGGLEGLRLLEENRDTCSLIILDVMMPDMNGIEALNEIKAESPETTVVMVTSVSQKEKMREAAKAGADGYVTKPFEAEDLGAELDDALDSPVTT